ncbi:hypothetical protein QDD76_004907 [Burkholderia cepacia]|nr:hypothetical protein [Burkholderia cepacia]MBA9834105.1 hypothetical protein [Burkholderia contaminans]OXI51631.1 hypothetical protein CFB47_39195 [Burkholderia sp. AU27893]EKS9805868.1 hypothetical protein [Burkholderia cepacia]EKS9813416.1 hypothetical protein [Burkholderia cepacia]
MVSRRGDGAVELSRTGEPRLPDVTIEEHPDANNAASTYQATVRATALCELAARRDDFATAEAAVAWATGFEFATRQVGSLTWYALAPNAPQWHAVIGASVAEIVSYERGGSPSYAVKRRLKFGTQSVEFSITDLAYRETPKNIVSFEQASAIALTMPDYVMELMRVPADATQPAGSAA